MRATSWIAIVSLLAGALLAPAATAHESYDIGNGQYTITVGDQNEPIYTFKWTNLDLIIRDSDGEPVPDAHEDLQAVLVGPGGEQLDRPLETQFGEEGRYEFDEGHFYTQPGQYTLELEGTIQGVDATGSYDLPGPRQPMSDFGFPHEQVPTVLELQEQIEGEEDEQQLQQRIDALESQLASQQEEIQTLRQNQQDIQQEQDTVPGLGLAAVLVALAAIAWLGVRPQR